MEDMTIDDMGKARGMRRPSYFVTIERKSYRQLWEEYAGQAMMAHASTPLVIKEICKQATEDNLDVGQVCAEMSFGIAQGMLAQLNKLIPPADRTTEDLDFLHHLLGDDVMDAVVDGVAEDCGIERMTQTERSKT